MQCLRVQPEHLNLKIVTIVACIVALLQHSFADELIYETLDLFHVKVLVLGPVLHIFARQEVLLGQEKGKDVGLGLLFLLLHCSN